MRLRGLLLIAVIASTSISFGSVFAQAFDPNCYFPTVGKPGEIDTIYGSKSWQQLSSGMNIGPAPGRNESRILMYGLPENPPFITAVSAGSTFNLHNLTVSAKTTLNLQVGQYRTGHFRSQRYTDILRTHPDLGAPTIYWADDLGNFDTARHTTLVPSYRGFATFYDAMNCYVSRLSSDTVDDVVLGAVTLILGVLDSNRLIYFKGGEKLYGSRDTAVSDEEVAVAPYLARYQWRHGVQGDWRGVGRDDLITGDGHGNTFYYHNNPPFRLDTLFRSLYSDTLWAARAIPSVDSFNEWLAWALPMVALPNHGVLHYQDLVCISPSVYPVADPRSGDILMFRGGADFGSHRLTTDSAEFVLKSPPNMTYMANCGRMSSSKDETLLLVGGSDDYYEQDFNFYLLGNSLDDSVDMRYSCVGWPYPTSVDTLSADADGLEDVAVGMAGYVTPTDKANGESNVGTVQIVHGSKRIPVKRSDVPEKVLPATGFDIFPNPLHAEGTISIWLDHPSTVEITLRDVLGRAVYNHRQHLSLGAQKLHINFGIHASGSYQLQIDTGQKLLTKQVLVVK